MSFRSMGLTSAEAERRRAEHGPNRLPEAARPSAARRLLAQVTSPLVLALLAAAVISLAVAWQEPGGWSRFGDSIAILLIVVANALLGFFQERQAEAALEALRKLEVPTARVHRDGELRRLPAVELVPGDVIELEAGDAVPADARLLESSALAVEEAALTGESVAAHKDHRAEETEGGTETRVFLGTTVVAGAALAEVTGIGAHTELGRIGKLIAQAGVGETPLEARLRGFGRRILWMCLGVSAALFALGLLRGRGVSAVLLEAVSFAVALIPEGLPAITTITLALGMRRMARRGAIVRKLPAVETLGAATVICTDKTGTLTQNRMTVRAVWAAGARHQVSGDGYAKAGAIAPASHPEGTANAGESLSRLLETAVLSSTATLEERDGERAVLGDPTEGALLVLAEKGGLAIDGPDGLRAAHQVVHKVPFEAARRRMTVVTRGPDGRLRAHVKGALDVILERCRIDADERRAAEAEGERLAAEGLRVLAFARRAAPDLADPERDLELLGLVGMTDPPRPGVREALAACRQAGIRAVMITGDHPHTAVAIGRELGLWEEGDRALTGVELARLPDDELARALKTNGGVRVFARVSAADKLRIVRAYRQAGEIVAMTGDGVNDAPALREAHIGVAMGRAGTDVARQAADLVLTDDNFATLVEAVREGRAIYRNIQKSIFFLLSSNAGLAVAVFTLSILGLLPLTPLMILWINLVTNGAPALALGVDPPDPEVMREPPHPPESPLIGWRDWAGTAFVGLVMGAAAVGCWFLPSQTPESARTLGFTLLALAPLFHAFSCRSPRESIVQMRPLVSPPLLLACAVSASLQLLAVLIPPLRPVFRTDAIVRSEWAVVLGGAFLVVPVIELAKVFLRLGARHRPAPRRAIPSPV